MPNPRSRDRLLIEIFNPTVASVKPNFSPHVGLNTCMVPTLSSVVANLRVPNNSVKGFTELEIGGFRLGEWMVEVGEFWREGVRASNETCHSIYFYGFFK